MGKIPIRRRAPDRCRLVLSQWTLVIIAIVLLMHVVGLLPVEELSAAQDSLDNRMLGVLGVAAGLAAIVMSSRE